MSAPASTGRKPGTTAEGLDALFAPRRIAVVGASRSPGKLGAVMARSLHSFATPGLDDAEINPLRVTGAGLVALDAVAAHTKEVAEVGDGPADR